MTWRRVPGTVGVVTDTALVAPDGTGAADRADRDAAAAADLAGVAVREISSLEEIGAVSELYGGIWARDSTAAISTELLRAFAKTGNYVAGAYDGSTLLGACVGFFSASAEGSLHSHMAGVSALARGRSVGYALKLHQRSWALRRGIRVIAWTFDPLVSRNAYFNLTKLGAAPAEYLVNFYGGMKDGINDGDDSDRLLVRWSLDSARVTALSQGRPYDAVPPWAEAGDAVVALGVSGVGAPVPGPLDAADSLVAVPRDIEAVRRADPGLARQWRAALRDALTALMTTGSVVTGFDPAGWYVLRRDPLDGRRPERSESVR